MGILRPLLLPLRRHRSRNSRIAGIGRGPTPELKGSPSLRRQESPPTDACTIRRPQNRGSCNWQRGRIFPPLEVDLITRRSLDLCLQFSVCPEKDLYAALGEIAIAALPDSGAKIAGQLPGQTCFVLILRITGELILDPICSNKSPRLARCRSKGNRQLKRTILNSPYCTSGKHREDGLVRFFIAPVHPANGIRVRLSNPTVLVCVFSNNGISARATLG